MTIGFSISSVTFSDGTTVETPAGGILAIVGPNNSGKTVSLRDILLSMDSKDAKRGVRAIRDVAIRTSGDTEALRRWLSKNAYKDRQPGPLTYHRGGARAAWSAIAHAWSNVNEGFLGPLLPFVTLYADVDNRANVASASSPMDFFNQVPTNPIQHLYLDGSLEEALSKISETTFGQPLTLQRLGGPEFTLRVGKLDVPIPLINRPTPEYARAEASLPRLADQGHGMRSYLGLALLLLVQAYHVTLIDEPEAFLHPPHRRALGRLVSGLSRQAGSQLFIATHDTEFLWGLLDGPSDVTVVRLTRVGDVNHAKQISADEARDLWIDPLLRYSRIFDGLFYERVVVTESDSDCRFFSAVADHLVESKAIPRPDVLFVPAGGKDRVHVAMSALRRVGVDCVAAVDFDIFRQEAALARLVESAGGNWGELAELRKRFAEQISSKRMGKPISGLRHALDQLLPSTEQDLDRETSRRVIELFSYKDGWEEAKKAGLSSVPSGDAYRACSTLIEKLARLGIYVSPVGELESFVRSVGGHGPRWVSEVFSQGAHKHATDAHRFVRRILDPMHDGS